MKDEALTLQKSTIARSLPAGLPAKLPATMKWEGRTIPLVLERRVWRARTRTKAFSCDINTGTGNLADAKRIVKKTLDEMPPPAAIDHKSLQFLAEIYLEAPKRSSADIARRNVVRMKSVVRDAAGTDLAGYRIADLPDLWPAYVAARQGLERPDYATRRAINRGINSAMRQAACLITRAMEPIYHRAGVILPPNAGRVLLAAESPKVPAEADDSALVEAWRALRETDLPMWLTVGLARFAGLRQSEILAFRGKWVIQKGGTTYVRLQDRPEDGFQTKTGIPYSALVMEPSLAEYLRSMDGEAPAVHQTNTVKWIMRKPQAWLKQFTGAAKAPLHRLRGLYADHVRNETEAAILARQDAIKEASRNLGHTSTRTTEKHYTSESGR